MPIAASAASYSPGDSLERGSFIFEPVIPAGSAGVGSRFCAVVVTAKERHKTKKTVNKRKALMCTRFIISILRFGIQKGLHNFNFGALPAIDIRREIKQFGILPGASRVEQFSDHHERAVVMLYHSLQK